MIHLVFLVPAMIISAVGPVVGDPRIAGMVVSALVAFSVGLKLGERI